MIPMKLIEPIAEVVCEIVKLGLHVCEFILPKESPHEKQIAKLEATDEQLCA